MIELSVAESQIKVEASHSYLAEITIHDENQKEQLLADIGSTLDFPEYYGRNLDALEECLGQMCWIEAPRVVLTIHDYAKLERGLRESLEEICAAAELALLPEKHLTVIAIR